MLAAASACCLELGTCSWASSGITTKEQRKKDKEQRTKKEKEKEHKNKKSKKEKRDTNKTTNNKEQEHKNENNKQQIKEPTMQLWNLHAQWSMFGLLILIQNNVHVFKLRHSKQLGLSIGFHIIANNKHTNSKQIDIEKNKTKKTKNKKQKRNFKYNKTKKQNKELNHKQPHTTSNKQQATSNKQQATTTIPGNTAGQ